MDKRLVYYFTCDSGNLHIIEACPRCSLNNKEGLVTGTAARTLKGMITAKCSDCGESVPFYVDSGKNQIWRMSAMEIKVGQIPDPTFTPIAAT